MSISIGTAIERLEEALLEDENSHLAPRGDLVECVKVLKRALSCDDRKGKKSDESIGACVSCAKKLKVDSSCESLRLVTAEEKNKTDNDQNNKENDDECRAEEEESSTSDEQDHKSSESDGESDGEGRVEWDKKKAANKAAYDELGDKQRQLLELFDSDMDGRPTVRLMRELGYEACLKARDWATWRHFYKVDANPTIRDAELVNNKTIIRQLMAVPL